MRLYFLFATFILLIFGSLFLMRRATVYRPPENTNSAEAVSLPTFTEPRVTFIDPIRGPRDARITIVEFSDFYCPYCYQLETALRQIIADYPNDVRLVWKDFPNNSLHPQASEAAAAARCADESNKFWEYHDLLYENTSNNQMFAFADLAASLGINRNNFSGCLESKQMEPIVTSTFLEGRALGVDGTPYVFINGRRFDGRSYEEFKAVIDNILNGN